MKRRLREEALERDAAIQKEGPQEIRELMESCEPFRSSRPLRQPVSIRLDPFAIATSKRTARRKTIPYTQLMALRLHERIEQEKTADRS